QPLRAKQDTAANKAFKAPVRRTLRERPMPQELETRQSYCPCSAEAAAVQAQSWYRVQAKPAAEVKYPSPMQVTVLHYLPVPVWWTRFGRCALHARRSFSCQLLPQ